MKKYFVVSFFICCFVVQNHLISSFNADLKQQEKPNDKGEREFKKLSLFNRGNVVGWFCSVRPHYSFSKNKQMQNHPNKANRAAALNALLTTRDEQILIEVRKFIKEVDTEDRQG